MAQGKQVIIALHIWSPPVRPLLDQSGVKVPTEPKFLRVSIPYDTRFLDEPTEVNEPFSL